MKMDTFNVLIETTGKDSHQMISLSNNLTEKRAGLFSLTLIMIIGSTLILIWEFGFSIQMKTNGNIILTKRTLLTDFLAME